MASENHWLFRYIIYYGNKLDRGVDCRSLCVSLSRAKVEEGSVLCKQLQDLLKFRIKMTISKITILVKPTQQRPNKLDLTQRHLNTLSLNNILKDNDEHGVHPVCTLNLFENYYYYLKIYFYSYDPALGGEREKIKGTREIMQ